MSIGPHLLGRRLEHDPASRNFTAPLRRTTAGLVAVTHTLAAPHLNQGDIGMCEGATAAEFLNSAKAQRNRRRFQLTTEHRNTNTYLRFEAAVQLYTVATTLDQFQGFYPGVDTGTSGLGIAKAMKAAGALERYEWTFSWSQFLGVLQRQPVMLGINWYDDMFTPDRAGFVHIGGSVAGGHAVLAFAYRPPGAGLARIGLTNHWVLDDGTPWGVTIGATKGCFWMTEVELEQLLIHEQGEALVPVLL